MLTGQLLSSFLIIHDITDFSFHLSHSVWRVHLVLFTSIGQTNINNQTNKQTNK